MPRPAASAAFAARYGEELRRYIADGSAGIERRPSGRLRQATMLGLDACELELTPLALARIHDGALAAMPSPAAVARGTHAQHPDAELFFNQVLAPNGANGHAPTDPAHRARLLRSALRRCTAELVQVRAHLHSEMERTKSLDAEIKARLRERDESKQTALRAAERLRQVTRQLLTAHEDERQRISRDLHDELGQNLTAVNLTLAGLRNAAAADAKELQRDVRRSQALLLKAMEKVRSFATELRPSLLDHLGLVPALRSLADSFARERRLDVRFSTDTEELGLGAEGATAMYRVAQEALTNVRRHARATRVDVIVRRLPAAVQMEIRDNGRSFDPDRARSNLRRGLGLHCMEERMALVGGTLVIHSSSGHGTSVLAAVPDIEVARE